jgi:peptidoglycan hydrolase CwlO-like protein
MALSNTATVAAALEYAKENPDYQRLQSLVKTRFDVLQNVESFKAMAEKLDESVKNLKAQLEKWKKEQDELKEKIVAKHKEFWNKYSSYIQEGVWSSEDYVDDELYYLDACSIAYTSARPQISYDI